MIGGVMFETDQAKAFFDAWLKLRDGNEIPHFRGLFSGLPPKLVPQLMIIEESDDGRFPIRFMGTERVEDWGSDLTQTDSLQALSPEFSEAAKINLKTVLDLPCGIRGITIGITSAGRKRETEYVLLPAGTDAGKMRRFVAFNSALGDVSYVQPVGKIVEISPCTWIDIGYGVPKERPRV